MTLQIPFDNSFARLPAHMFARLDPTPVQDPSLIAFNHDLARELGVLGAKDDAELAQIFAGNLVPDGAEPLAQLYAAHQFGHWNPQLGDGRAILLGEVTKDAGRHDIQLKGSGRTPFSRNGDGRAALGPVLREYVVSEAMHALGIPTTRALAAVTTGERVQRETALPGAIVTRVASSHIRVGTFQVYAARQDMVGLTALFEHVVDRHYPDAANPLDLLQAVIRRQADLIVQWMSVGFIHGVMNTDNCAVSGETIDYGPCAFMDEFHPMQKFSSIDQHGRYAYGAQPNIIVWNMAQLATALLPLMPDPEGSVEVFTEAVHAMPAFIQKLWLQRLGEKIGIAQATAADEDLITDLLGLMAQQRADFTNTFRALSGGSARDEFTDTESYSEWHDRWEDRLKTESSPQELMLKRNPFVIPRNHVIEAMIQSATDGDYAPFHQLNDILANPFKDQSVDNVYIRPPLDDERVHATFCGT